MGLKLLFFLTSCWLGSLANEWPQLNRDYFQQSTFDVMFTMRLKPAASDDYLSVNFVSVLKTNRIQPNAEYAIDSHDVCFKALVENPSFLLDSSLSPISASIPAPIMENLKEPFIFCYDNGKITQVGVMANNSMELNSDVNNLKAEIAYLFQVRDHSFHDARSGTNIEDLSPGFRNCRALYLIDVGRELTTIRRSVKSETCTRKTDKHTQWTKAQKVEVDPRNKNRLLSAKIQQDLTRNEPDPLDLKILSTIKFKQSNSVGTAISISSDEKYMLYGAKLRVPIVDNYIEKVLFHWVREHDRQALKKMDDANAMQLAIQSLNGNFTNFGQLNGARSAFLKFLVAAETDESTSHFAKLVEESKVGLIEAAHALNSLHNVEQLSATSIKRLSDLCKNESLHANHNIEKLLFEQTCWIQVAFLSKEYIRKLNNDYTAQGLHIIIELRNQMLDRMQTAYEDTLLSEDRRTNALRAIGNLGHPSSLMLLRQIVAKESKLLNKIVAMDALRNIDQPEATFERSELLIDFLDQKINSTLQTAAIVSFFDSQPTSTQINSFWSLVDKHGLVEMTVLAFEFKIKQRIANGQKLEQLLHFCQLSPLASTCSKISQFEAVDKAKRRMPFSHVNSLRLLGFDRAARDFKAIFYKSAGLLDTGMDLLDVVEHLSGQQMKQPIALEQLEIREFKRISNNSALDIIETVNALNSVQLAHLATGQITLISYSNLHQYGKILRHAGYDLMLPISFNRNSWLDEEVERTLDQTVTWPRYLQTALFPAKFLGIDITVNTASTLLGVFPRSSYHAPKPLLNNAELTIHPTSESARANFYGGSKQVFHLQSSLLNITFGEIRTVKINAKPQKPNVPYSIKIESKPILSINFEPVETLPDQTPLNRRQFNGTLFNLDAEWRWLPKTPFDYDSKSFGNNILQLNLSEPVPSTRNLLSFVTPTLNFMRPIHDLHSTERILFQMHETLSAIKNENTGLESEEVRGRCDREINLRGCSTQSGETTACTQCKRMVKLAKETIAAVRAPVKTANEAVCAQSNTPEDFDRCAAMTNMFYDGLLGIMSNISIEDFVCKYIVTPCASTDELKMKKFNRISCEICEATANSLFDALIAYHSSQNTNLETLCPAEKVANQDCLDGISPFMEFIGGGIKFGKPYIKGVCRSRLNCAKNAAELNDKIDIKPVT